MENKNTKLKCIIIMSILFFFVEAFLLLELYSVEKENNDITNNTVKEAETNELVLYGGISRLLDDTDVLFGNIHISSSNEIKLNTNASVTSDDVSVNQLKFDIELSESELQLLTALVYSESGVCTDEHQKAVTCVILNRYNSEQFPNSIKEIAYQINPIQYACAFNGQLETNLNYLRDLESTKSIGMYDNFIRCQKNVIDVLNNGYNGFGIHGNKVIYQAEFKQGTTTVLIIGNTYFCY